MFLHVLFHDVLVVILHSFPSLAMQIELVQVGSRGIAESNFGVSWSLGIRVPDLISSTIDSLRRVETSAVDLRVVFSPEPLKQLSLNYFRR